MAQFYNTPGGTIVNGTSVLDRYFAFTSDDNFDNVNPDAFLLLFRWVTSIRRADGSFFEITGANMQVSLDVYNGNGGVDVLYGSNRNDAIFYNNGMFQDGVGGINGIQQFFMGKGDDIADFSAHGPGGVSYAKQVLVNGEDGNDTIVGGANNDELSGQAGDDFIVGNAGGDTIDGGDGNDQLYGDDLGALDIAGQDLIRGRAGNDTLYGGAKADRLEGGDDNDILYGGRSDDSLSGGNGADILYGDDDGFGGGDKLFGDAGDDQLYGGGAADVIDGGADNDTSYYSGNRFDYGISLNADGSFQVLDLRAGSPDGNDTVRNVEFFQFADGLVPVGALNNPPVITSDGGGATASIAVAENSAYVTTVTATDIDVGQALSFSIAGGADARYFSIDAVTGVLGFLAAPDFENPIDADGDGMYAVLVRASDSTGGNDTQLISVGVTDLSDGAPPVITSNGGNRSAVIAVDENSTFVTTVQATDADSASITYRIAGGGDAARFSIDAVTGVLSFLQPPDFEQPTDADSDGDYHVIVEASDGLNGDRQELSVQLANLNDNAPAITSNGGGDSAALVLNENDLAVTVVTAADADGSAIVYSITGGADAARFSIDAATGALAFIVAPDFEQPVDAGADNVYDVIVQASDGVFSDQQALAVAIANTNDNSPVITSNGGGAAALIVKPENGLGVTTIVATDADGAQPSYRIAGGADAALFLLDGATGVLTFRSAPDFEDPDDSDRDNIYEVTVEAFDGVAADAQALTVQITDINEIGRTITGTIANDVITPTASNVAFRTTALNDTVFGLAGNDSIDGGAGTDRMEGGEGNDTYTVDTFVDDAKTTNDDLVVELVNGGVDRVNTLVNYRLAAQVENLTMLGIAALSGWGNDLANQMVGNAGANLIAGAAGNDTILGNDGADTLHGDDGNDTLVGGAGADNLFGGLGNDRVDGGIGADRLDGGAGNDTHIIDTWSDDGDSTNDDVVIELAGGGTDAASASVSYRLDAEVENLTLTGTLAINGTGTNLANTITGNAAANVLTGLGGNDTLNGAAGDDSLFGGNDSDLLDGGIGNDRLDGGSASDTLRGSTGVDILIGGAGKDTLTGGTEADAFVFVFGDTTLNTNQDRITDFVTAVDVIDIDAFAAPLQAVDYAESTIAGNSFGEALTKANTFASPGRLAVFIAGTTDGWLFWDATGDGLFEQSVLLNGLNTLAKFDSFDVI